MSHDRDQRDEPDRDQHQEEVDQPAEGLEATQRAVGKRWAGETAYEYCGQREAGLSSC